MCTRFTTVRLNRTGSSKDVGSGVAGQYIGLIRAAMPKGTASPMGYWHVADLEASLADLTAAGATDESRSSVLTLGVEAL